MSIPSFAAVLCSLVPSAVAPRSLPNPAPTVPDAGVLAGGNTWFERAPLARARQETGGARVGNDVYVVGGLRDGGGLIRAMDSVEVFDMRRGHWRQVAKMPAR